MVKIAAAGGSGNISNGIIAALAATKKHEILILSRRDPPATEKVPGITWVKADYSDQKQLTSSFEGVHTVLSFVGGVEDPGSVLQKNIIGAAIAAGVQCYAPSECSSSSIEELPWYAEKGTIRELLKEINKEKKVLEYTLFQLGMMVDYLAPPGSTTITSTQELFIDLNKRRAITLEGKDIFFTLTTAEDLAQVVVRAIDYEGEWPLTGGVHGTTISSSELIKIGEKINHGKPLDITSLREDDVRAENIESPWIPKFEHPDLSAEQNEYFLGVVF